MTERIYKTYANRKKATVTVPKGKQPKSAVPDIIAAAKKKVVTIPKNTKANGLPKSL